MWAETWNHHVISSTTEPHRTPLQKFNHGLVTQGIRGGLAPLVPNDPEEVDEAGYGIDWQDLDTRSLQRHHSANNVSELDDHLDPFTVNAPARLAHVEVPDTRCPFSSPEQVAILDQQLDALPDRHSPGDISRTGVWQQALQFARQILEPLSNTS